MEPDYDLSLITALAAVGIDNYIRKKSTIEYHDKIEELVKYLSTESKKEYLNPTTHSMYAELFWPNKEDGRGKRQKDVQKEIGNLAGELSELRRVSPERQEQLVGICVKLSNKMMGNMETNYRLELVA